MCDSEWERDGWSQKWSDKVWQCMNESALLQYNVPQHWDITVDIVVYVQKLTAAIWDGTNNMTIICVRTYVLYVCITH